MFCARPKIYLHILAVTKILCQTKRLFAFSKIGFCAIYGPVKGQGIYRNLTYKPLKSLPKLTVAK
jgi:hypothetical protein